jgi:hypothetical protein
MFCNFRTSIGIEWLELQQQHIPIAQERPEEDAELPVQVHEGHGPQVLAKHEVRQEVQRVKASEGRRLVLFSPFILQPRL